jgi:uncharacterized protein YicC (UPF0701 family)
MTHRTPKAFKVPAEHSFKRPSKRWLLRVVERVKDYGSSSISAAAHSPSWSRAYAPARRSCRPACVTELGIAVDAGRFEQEVALMLQRADVDEELDRLDGHIVEIRRVIEGDEAAGRRLDFLMQELNREANTLSSKSQELDVTRIAVDMIVLIEQMREQVQNIE